MKLKHKVEHDPIQQREAYLEAADLETLKKTKGVCPKTIMQCLGDVVVVPGCLPHQVSC